MQRSESNYFTNYNVFIDTFLGNWYCRGGTDDDVGARRSYRFCRAIFRAVRYTHRYLIYKLSICKEILSTLCFEKRSTFAHVDDCTHIQWLIYINFYFQVMRKPVRKTSLFKFMTVLRLEVWLSIVGALTLTGIMIWILDKYSPYSARNNKRLYPYPCR